MNYTGERIVPAHDDKPGQGNIDEHDLMYREFLVAAKNNIVIDIACGCGYGTKMLAAKAKEVYGFDINPETVEFAKKYSSAPNIAYNVGDIRQIQAADNCADVVVSVETFEHVVEVEQMIYEVQRVLKSKGFWCFTTPNGERYPDHRIVQYHVKHYTAQMLHNLLDKFFNIHIRETCLEPDSSLILDRPIFGNYSVFAIRKF